MLRKQRERAMSEKMTLGDILRNINEIDENYNLYLPKGIDSLRTETPCLLLNSNFEDEDKMEDIIYTYVLGIYSINDIVDNLNQQIKNPTMEQKLYALNFYIQNDAFADFENIKM
ncbi:MAG: hypothetical protein FJX71_06655 [Alphaproteobacteria bacterium]|nr:hypothetical protein [Alphaproteobacteria bacterium]